MKIDLMGTGIPFFKIGFGQCFEFKGAIYMRIQSIHIEYDYGYATRLSDGFVLEINSDESVHILNLKVVEDTDKQ